MWGKWPCSQSQVSKWQLYASACLPDYKLLWFSQGPPSPNYSHRHTHTLYPQLLTLPCHHNSEAAQA